MRYNCTLLVVFLFLGAFFTGMTTAQEADLSPEVKAMVEAESAALTKALNETDSVLNVALDTPVDDLGLMAQPLTKAELETEIAYWIEALKVTAQAHNRCELELKHLGEAAGQEDLSSLKAALLKKRSQLVERCEVIKGALEAKGGDVADLDKYLAIFATSMGDGITDLSSLDTGLVTDLVGDLKEWVIKPDGGIKWGLKILFFILILIAAKIAAAILGSITNKAVGSFKRTSELLRDFFVNTVKKVTFFIGVIIALSVVGIDIGPFLAAMGMVGFIVGFALQGTLSNFASGIMILLYRPYDIGDAVSVAGVTGKVSSMTLVSTTVKTFDNQKVVVPNGSIWGDVITNITGSDTRRVDMVFGIGYSDDIEKAQKILEDVLSSHPKVLKDPAPVVKLHELADSSVNFVTRPWSLTGDYWDVYWDVTRTVKERFDAEGVSIPFPQRDVHVFNETAE